MCCQEKLKISTTILYRNIINNYLNWKPAGATDLFKSWKVHISRCWNADNSSGMDLLLGKWWIICCVGNEDVYLKVFEDKRLVQDSSITVAYFFHVFLKNFFFTSFLLYKLHATWPSNVTYTVLYLMSDFRNWHIKCKSIIRTVLWALSSRCTR